MAIALVVIDIIIVFIKVEQTATTAVAFVGPALSFGLPLFQARQNPDIIAKQSH